uniref:Gsp_15 putative toxin n=1 Tax=Gemmula speciosa TaxID=439592 RepID=A0A098LXV1_GEMSP
MKLSLDILMCITMATIMTTVNAQTPSPEIQSRECQPFQVCAVSWEGNIHPMCQCGGQGGCPVYVDGHGIDNFAYFCENVNEAERCRDINEEAIIIRTDWYGRLRCRCRTYEDRQGSLHVYCKELLGENVFRIMQLSKLIQGN